MVTYTRCPVRTSLTAARARLLQKNRILAEFPSAGRAAIEIFAFQLETVSASKKMDPIRMIIADEPGLGKTIQAALIAIEAMEDNRANSVLIAVPKSLRNQWKSELKSKLRVNATVLETREFRELDRADVDGIYISSIDTIANNLEKIQTLGFDMVIIDEAHHCAWRDRKASKTNRRKAAEQLAKHKHLVLCTATPIQLGLFDFWSIIHLVKPGVFKDHEVLQYYLRKYQPVAIKYETGIASKEEIEWLKTVAVQTFGWSLPSDRGHLPDDFLPTRQIIFRHRKREEFPNLPPRLISTVQVQYTQEERKVYAMVRDAIMTHARNDTDGRYSLMLCILHQLLTSSPKALLRTLKRTQLSLDTLMDEESRDDNTNENTITTAEFRPLINALESLNKDSKMEALLSFVVNQQLEDKDKNILIFTRFLGTQRYIVQELSRFGIRVIEFNGLMNDEERDAAIVRFKSPGTVLVSTESGGEGRNMEFCNVLVNYDLPWNPVRMEQRIGRIDRITQRRQVHAFNMAVWDTVEQRMFDRLQERHSLWQESLGSCEKILGNLETDIFKLRVVSQEDEHSIERFLDQRLEQARRADGLLSNLHCFQRDSRLRESIKLATAELPTPEQWKDFIISAAEVDNMPLTLKNDVLSIGNHLVAVSGLEPGNEIVRHLLSSMMKKKCLLSFATGKTTGKYIILTDHDSAFICKKDSQVTAMPELPECRLDFIPTPADEAELKNAAESALLSLKQRNHASSLEIVAAIQVKAC